MENSKAVIAISIAFNLITCFMIMSFVIYTYSFLAFRFPPLLIRFNNTKEHRRQSLFQRRNTGL